MLVFGAVCHSTSRVCQDCFGSLSLEETRLSSENVSGPKSRPFRCDRGPCTRVAKEERKEGREGAVYCNPDIEHPPSDEFPTFCFLSATGRAMPPPMGKTSTRSVQIHRFPMCRTYTPLRFEQNRLGILSQTVCAILTPL